MYHSKWISRLLILQVVAVVYIPFSTAVEASEEKVHGSPEHPATERLLQYVDGLPILFCLDSGKQGCATSQLPSSTIVPLCAIHIYQRVISSSLGRRCRFRPSCSEFARQALRKKGLFTGIIMTADRLARDHGFIRPGDYPRDESGRFLDPVETRAARRHRRVPTGGDTEAESRLEELNRLPVHE